MKRGKKGLELMINTYVLIVLAILTAVILIIFWEIETGKFSNFLREISGKTNVDNVVAICNSLGARQASYEYCCSKKEIKYLEEGKVKQETLTCNEISQLAFGSEIEKMECKDVC